VSAWSEVVADPDKTNWQGCCLNRLNRNRSWRAVTLLASSTDLTNSEPFGLDTSVQYDAIENGSLLPTIHRNTMIYRDTQTSNPFSSNSPENFDLRSLRNLGITVMVVILTVSLFA
jgi:hypothetical protein